MLQKSLGKFWRVTAIVTLIAYIPTNFSYAGVIAPQAEISIPAFSQFSQGLALTLPTKLGHIDSLHPGYKGIIVHLQTAHGHYEAQVKIQKILDRFAAQYGSYPVLLEGAAGKLDPQRINFFPGNPERTQKAAHLLAMQALIKGPELYLLDHPAALAQGIENEFAYWVNQRQFAAVLRAREGSQEFLDSFDREMEKAAAIFDPALRSFLTRAEQHELGMVSYEAWTEELKKNAQKYLEVDLTDAAWQLPWPMLVRFFKIQKISKEWNASKYEVEKKAFLKQAERYLPGLRSPVSGLYEKVEKLLNSAGESIQLPEPETENTFAEMLRYFPHDFNFKTYPNVMRFMGLLILQSEVRPAAFASEIEQIEKLVMDKLARNESEKEMLAIFSDYRLLKKLLALQLTPGDFLKIRKNNAEGSVLDAKQRGLTPVVSEIQPSALARRLQKIKTVSAKRSQFVHLREIDGVFQTAVAFYQGAKNRDTLMIQNTENYLKKNPAKFAVVVTGGFHTDAMRKQLEKEGYTYVVVTPAISGPDEKGYQAYLKSMLQESAAYRMPGIAQTMAHTIPNTLNRNLESPYGADPVGGEAMHRFELQTLVLTARSGAFNSSRKEASPVRRFVQRSSSSVKAKSRSQRSEMRVEWKKTFSAAVAKIRANKFFYPALLAVTGIFAWLRHDWKWMAAGLLGALFFYVRGRVSARQEIFRQEERLLREILRKIESTATSEIKTIAFYVNGEIGIQINLFLLEGKVMAESRRSLAKAVKWEFSRARQKGRNAITWDFSTNANTVTVNIRSALRSEMRLEEIKPILKVSTDALTWFGLLNQYRPAEAADKMNVTIQIARGVKLQIPMSRSLLQDPAFQESAYRYIAAWAYNLSIRYGTSFIAVGVEGEPDLVKESRIADLLTQGDLSRVNQSTELSQDTVTAFGVQNYANGGGEKISFKKISDLTPQEKEKKKLDLGIALQADVKGNFLGMDLGGGSAKFAVISNGKMIEIPEDLQTLPTVLKTVGGEFIAESPEQFAMRIADHIDEIRKAVLGAGINFDGVGLDTPGAKNLTENQMETLGQIPTEKRWSMRQVQHFGLILPVRVKEKLGLNHGEVLIRNDMDGVGSGVAWALAAIKPELLKGHVRVDWLGTGFGNAELVNGIPMNAPTEVGHCIFNFGRPGDAIYDSEAFTGIPGMLHSAITQATNNRNHWNDLREGEFRPLAEALPVQPLADNLSALLRNRKSQIANRVLRNFADKYASNLAIHYFMTQGTGEGSPDEIVLGGGIVREDRKEVFKQVIFDALRKYDLQDKIKITILTEKDLAKKSWGPGEHQKLSQKNIGPIGMAMFIQSVLAEKQNESAQRSELRDMNKSLWMGLDAPTADWQRMNTMVWVYLDAKKDGDSIAEADLKPRMSARLIDMNLGASNDQLTALWAEIQRTGLLENMDAAALSSDAAFYIQAQLLEALNNKENLPAILAAYDKAADDWPKYPLESRWPVMRAVAMMKKDDQKKLLRQLISAPEKFGSLRVTDAIFLMLGEELLAPEEWEAYIDQWMQFHTPNLIGRRIYYVSPETWLLAGGLGRVGQYHTRAIHKLLAKRGKIVTIEGFYHHKIHADKSTTPIDYEKLETPIKNLKAVYEFEVVVLGTKVKVIVREGRTEDGIPVYLLDGGKYTAALYKYSPDIQDPPFPLPTWKEFSEFFSKASLELIRILEKTKQGENANDYKSPVIWGNDGQTGYLPPEKRKMDKATDILRKAIVWFTTHTFLNRGPVESVDSNGSMDPTSQGVRASHGRNGVAAPHVHEVSRRDPQARMVSVPNGDDLDRSAAFFRKMLLKLYPHPGEVDVWRPTGEQIIAAKKEGIRELNIKYKGIWNAELNPDLPVISYLGRFVHEKSGRERAWTIYNIRQLILSGANVLYEGNVQTIPNKVFEELQKAAAEINTLAEKEEREQGRKFGRVVVRTGFGLEEQVDGLGISHIIVADSNYKTGASEITEMNGAVNGALIMGPAWTEGNIQKIGIVLNPKVAGSGNILIPKDDKPGSYLEVLLNQVNAFHEKPAHFGSYLEVAVKLSRVVNALNPGAQYMREFNAILNRQNNLEPLVGMVKEIRKPIQQGEPLPQKLATWVAEISQLSREEAAKKYGEEKVFGLAGLAVFLAPETLEAFRSWNLPQFSMLENYLKDPVNQLLFGEGSMLRLHRTDHYDTVMFSRSHPKTGRILTPFFYLGIEPWDQQANKVWARNVQNMSSLLAARDDVFYSVGDYSIPGEEKVHFYDKAPSAQDLVYDFRAGIPVTDHFAHDANMHHLGLHAQLLFLEPTARSEIRKVPAALISLAAVGVLYAGYLLLEPLRNPNPAADNMPDTSGAVRRLTKEEEAEFRRQMSEEQSQNKNNTQPAPQPAVLLDSAARSEMRFGYGQGWPWNNASNQQDSSVQNFITTLRMNQLVIDFKGNEIRIPLNVSEVSIDAARNVELTGRSKEIFDILSVIAYRAGLTVVIESPADSKTEERWLILESQPADKIFQEKLKQTIEDHYPKLLYSARSEMRMTMDDLYKLIQGQRGNLDSWKYTSGAVSAQRTLSLGQTYAMLSVYPDGNGWALEMKDAKGEMVWMSWNRENASMPFAFHLRSRNIPGYERADQNPLVAFSYNPDLAKIRITFSDEQEALVREFLGTEVETAHSRHPGQAPLGWQFVFKPVRSELRKLAEELAKLSALDVKGGPVPIYVDRETVPRSRLKLDEAAVFIFKQFGGPQSPEFFEKSLKILNDDGFYIVRGVAMSGEFAARSKKVDQHYGLMAGYASKGFSSQDANLKATSEHIYGAAAIILPADVVLEKYNVTADELAGAWDSLAPPKKDDAGQPVWTVDRRNKIGEGAYVAKMHLKKRGGGEEDVVVINGHYPQMRQTWAEQKTIIVLEIAPLLAPAGTKQKAIADFRIRLGDTNPAKAGKDTLRGMLGQKEGIPYSGKVGYGPNGFHGSADAKDAAIEEKNWFGNLARSESRFLQMGKRTSKFLNVLDGIENEAIGFQSLLKNKGFDASKQPEMLADVRNFLSTMPAKFDELVDEWTLGGTVLKWQIKFFLKTDAQDQPEALKSLESVIHIVTLLKNDANYSYFSKRLRFLGRTSFSLIIRVIAVLIPASIASIFALLMFSPIWLPAFRSWYWDPKIEKVIMDQTRASHLDGKVIQIVTVSNFKFGTMFEGLNLAAFRGQNRQDIVFWVKDRQVIGAQLIDGGLNPLRPLNYDEIHGGVPWMIRSDGTRQDLFLSNAYQGLIDLKAGHLILRTESAPSVAGTVRSEFRQTPRRPAFLSNQEFREQLFNSTESPLTKDEIAVLKGQFPLSGEEFLSVSQLRGKLGKNSSQTIQHIRKTGLNWAKAFFVFQKRRKEGLAYELNDLFFEMARIDRRLAGFAKNQLSDGASPITDMGQLLTKLKAGDLTTDRVGEKSIALMREILEKRGLLKISPQWAAFIAHIESGNKANLVGRIKNTLKLLQIFNWATLEQKIQLLLSGEAIRGVKSQEAIQAAFESARAVRSEVREIVLTAKRTKPIALKKGAPIEMFLVDANDDNFDAVRGTRNEPGLLADLDQLSDEASPMATILSDHEFRLGILNGRVVIFDNVDGHDHDGPTKHLAVSYGLNGENSDIQSAVYGASLDLTPLTVPGFSARVESLTGDHVEIIIEVPDARSEHRLSDGAISGAVADVAENFRPAFRSLLTQMDKILPNHGRIIWSSKEIKNSLPTLVVKVLPGLVFEISVAKNRSKALITAKTSFGLDFKAEETSGATDAQLQTLGVRAMNAVQEHLSAIQSEPLTSKGLGQMQGTPLWTQGSAPKEFIYLERGLAMHDNNPVISFSGANPVSFKMTVSVPEGNFGKDLAENFGRLLTWKYPQYDYQLKSEGSRLNNGRFIWTIEFTRRSEARQRADGEPNPLTMRVAWDPAARSHAIQQQEAHDERRDERNRRFLHAARRNHNMATFKKRGEKTKSRSESRESISYEEVLALVQNATRFKVENVPGTKYKLWKFYGGANGDESLIQLEVFSGKGGPVEFRGVKYFGPSGGFLNAHRNIDLNYESQWGANGGATARISDADLAQRKARLLEAATSKIKARSETREIEFNLDDKLVSEVTDEFFQHVEAAGQGTYKHRGERIFLIDLLAGGARNVNEADPALLKKQAELIQALQAWIILPDDLGYVRNLMKGLLKTRRLIFIVNQTGELSAFREALTQTYAPTGNWGVVVNEQLRNEEVYVLSPEGSPRQRPTDRIAQRQTKPVKVEVSGSKIKFSIPVRSEVRGYGATMLLVSREKLQKKWKLNLVTHLDVRTNLKAHLIGQIRSLPSSTARAKATAAVENILSGTDMFLDFRPARGNPDVMELVKIESGARSVNFSLQNLRVARTRAASQVTISWDQKTEPGDSGRVYFSLYEAKARSESRGKQTVEAGVNHQIIVVEGGQLFYRYRAHFWSEWNIINLGAHAPIFSQAVARLQNASRVEAEMIKSFFDPRVLWIRAFQEKDKILEFILVNAPDPSKKDGRKIIPHEISDEDRAAFKKFVQRYSVPDDASADLEVMRGEGKNSPALFRLFVLRELVPKLLRSEMRFNKRLGISSLVRMLLSVSIAGILGSCAQFTEAVRRSMEHAGPRPMTFTTYGYGNKMRSPFSIPQVKNAPLPTHFGNGQPSSGHVIPPKRSEHRQGHAPWTMRVVTLILAMDLSSAVGAILSRNGMVGSQHSYFSNMGIAFGTAAAFYFLLRDFLIIIFPDLFKLASPSQQNHAIRVIYKRGLITAAIIPVAFFCIHFGVLWNLIHANPFLYLLLSVLAATLIVRLIPSAWLVRGENQTVRGSSTGRQPGNGNVGKNQLTRYAPVTNPFERKKTAAIRQILANVDGAVFPDAVEIVGVLFYQPEEFSESADYWKAVLLARKKVVDVDADETVPGSLADFRKSLQGAHAFGQIAVPTILLDPKAPSPELQELFFPEGSSSSSTVESKAKAWFVIGKNDAESTASNPDSDTAIYSGVEDLLFREAIRQAAENYFRGNPNFKKLEVEMAGEEKNIELKIYYHDGETEANLENTRKLLELLKQKFQNEFTDASLPEIMTGAYIWMRLARSEARVDNNWQQFVNLSRQLGGKAVAWQQSDAVKQKSLKLWIVTVLAAGVTMTLGAWLISLATAMTNISASASSLTGLLGSVLVFIAAVTLIFLKDQTPANIVKAKQAVQLLSKAIDGGRYGIENDSKVAEARVLFAELSRSGKIFAKQIGNKGLETVAYYYLARSEVRSLPKDLTPSPSLGNQARLIYAPRVIRRSEQRPVFGEAQITRQPLQTRVAILPTLVWIMRGIVPRQFLMELATSDAIALIMTWTGAKAFADEIPQPIVGVLAQQAPSKTLAAPQSKFVQNNTQLILDSAYVDLLLEANDAKGLYAVLKDTAGLLILLDMKGGLRDRIRNKLTNLKSGLSVEQKNKAKNWMSALVIVGNQTEVATWAAKPGVAVLLTSNSILKNIRGKIVLELLNAVSAEDYEVLVAMIRDLRQAAALGDIVAAQNYLNQRIQGLQRRPNGGWSVMVVVQALLKAGELIDISA